MLEAMALRSVAGGVSLGLMIAVSATQGRRLFFLCRRLGLLAQARTARRRRRRTAREPSMTIRSDEAAAMLADVESVVAKVKQSRIYRSAALIIILWGVVDLVRDGLIAIAPAWFGSRWFFVDAVGVAGTIAILRLSAGPGARLPFRTLAAFVLVLRLRLDLGESPRATSAPREQMAFWPTLFLFGYALAGLWFGPAFTAIGLGLTALDPRRIFLVGRGVHSVARRRHRRRLHSLRPLDAAGLSDGRARTTSSISRSACASWRR